MIKSNTRCDKCNKNFKSPKALMQHKFMMHTHAGSKTRKMKRGPRKFKTKPPIVMNEGSSFNTAPKNFLAYCPCCGVDLRKISIALVL